MPIFKNLTMHRRWQQLVRYSTMFRNTPKINIPSPMATKLFIPKPPPIKIIECRSLCSSILDPNVFEKACEETLESLTEYFEEIVEKSTLNDADVAYSSGVLTVNLGAEHGTYVINRQSPNKQIWLSSPVSGPKRFDLNSADEYWIYRHTGETLHQLLQSEISQVLKSGIDFSQCAYSKL